MICTAPIKSAGTEFPCGQCIACRINKARQWSTRLRLEWLQSSTESGLPGAFVTLTYAPEHLPRDGSVQKRDVQLFMMRLRKAWAEESRHFIRYYAVGEYGEVHGRAHYHVLLFNVDPVWIEANIRKVWTVGVTHVGTISPSSVAYVADYCLKALKQSSCCADGRKPPFRLMSRRPGIGGNAWAAVASALRGSGIADDLDAFGVPREVRLPASNERSEVMPLDRYMARGIENMMGLDGHARTNFERQLNRAYRLPVMTKEEKADRRRAAAAKALSKIARRRRKAKL